MIYMTATKRRNYKLVLDYICLDMMKHAINKLAWQYTDIALYDVLNRKERTWGSKLCGSNTT